MATTRTFIAVCISPAMQGRAAALAAQLDPPSGGCVKWVSESQLHITLKFLGDVDQERLGRVQQVVRETAAASPALTLSCAGLGAFPNLRRPSVLWLGAPGGGQELASLARQLDRNLSRLRFPRERRPFHPHLTMGRVRRGLAAPPELTAALSQMADFDAGACRVDRLVVFASQLHPAGPIYQVLEEAPLGG